MKLIATVSGVKKPVSINTECVALVITTMEDTDQGIKVSAYLNRIPDVNSLALARAITKASARIVAGLLIDNEEVSSEELKKTIDECMKVQEETFQTYPRSGKKEGGHNEQADT